jgi:hypothetical protein
LAAGLALNTALGPLGLDVIGYGLSESLHNQLVGLDGASLLLVVPVTAAAGVLAWRGRAAGPVLALGAATYTSYMFVQYLIGPGYERYPGALTLHLGLFVLGGVITVAAWSDLRPTELPAMTERQRRARARVLVGLAAFVVLRYLPPILGSFSSEPLTDEFRDEPAFFWTILLMDLGIVVPCALAASVVVRRGGAVAGKALYATVGWFALVPPSVAAMALTIVVNDDPNASAASMVLFVAAAIVFAAFATRVFRPLLGSQRGGDLDEAGRR